MVREIRFDEKFYERRVVVVHLHDGTPVFWQARLEEQPVEAARKSFLQPFQHYGDQLLAVRATASELAND